VKARTPVRRPSGGLSNAVVGKPVTTGSILAHSQGSHARDSGRPAVTPVTPAAARAEAASGGEETVTPRQLCCGSGSWRISDCFAQFYISKQCCGSGSASGSASFWYWIRIRSTSNTNTDPEIRISIKLISWIQIRFADDKPKCSEYEPI
jgi:hypothetical protein